MFRWEGEQEMGGGKGSKRDLKEKGIENNGNRSLVIVKRRNGWKEGKERGQEKELMCVMYMYTSSIHVYVHVHVLFHNANMY